MLRAKSLSCNCALVMRMFSSLEMGRAEINAVMWLDRINTITSHYLLLKQQKLKLYFYSSYLKNITHVAWQSNNNTDFCFVTEREAKKFVNTHTHLFSLTHKHTVPHTRTCTFSSIIVMKS